MASELKVDKFTGVTTAGSILVTGEGNSTTTNLQQGLAKAWCAFDMADNSDYILDSLNTGSFTDHGTGGASINFSNAMGNANYSATHMTSMQSDAREINTLNFDFDQSGSGTAPTTTAVRVFNAAGATANLDATSQDPKRASITIHGDLA